MLHSVIIFSFIFKIIKCLNALIDEVLNITKHKGSKYLNAQDNGLRLI